MFLPETYSCAGGGMRGGIKNAASIYAIYSTRDGAK